MPRRLWSSPCQDGVAGELAAIVADDHLRLAALDHQPVQFPRHTDAGERGVRHQRQALAGTIVDDGQDAEPAAIGQQVRHEVEGPPMVSSSGNVIGARVPSARLRPPRRRTVSRSSRYSRNRDLTFRTTNFSFKCFAAAVCNYIRRSLTDTVRRRRGALIDL